MNFHLASAILRGEWLIDKGWTETNLPLIVRLMKGEDVTFGTKAYDDPADRDTGPKKVEAPKPIAIVAVGSTARAGVYSVYPYTDLSRIPDGSIAQVSMIGPVMKYGGLCSYGSVDHAQNLSRLGASPNIAGVILNVDSPGGQTMGLGTLSDAVRATAAQKPVIAVVDDGLAASAMMWIISGASEIYATQKSSQIGSVGVYTTITDFYSYFEKEGLKVTDVYAPQSTDKNKPYRDALQGNFDLLKKDLSETASQFISTIRTNRAGKLANDSWTTGKLFKAPEAARIGLIDGIKPMGAVYQRMQTLISNKANKNSSAMSFERTLTAANSQQFEVAEGGFLLTESQLNAIEQALSTGDTDRSNLQASIDSQKTAHETAIADLKTAHKAETDRLTGEVTTLKGEKKTLEDKVKSLEESAPEFSQTTSAGDPNPKKPNKYETSYDREARELKAVYGQ